MQDSTGFVRLDRTTIKMTGQDRQKFLHNLCTNDIVKLTSGSGCEAFLCSVQGKILGYLFVTCHEDCLILDADAGFGDAIMAQLDKYLITEDVQLEDLTGSMAVVALMGSKAGSFASEQLGVGEVGSYLQHASAQIAGKSVELICDDTEAPLSRFVLRMSTTDVEPVVAQLQSLGVTEISEPLAEAYRIVDRRPKYGVDITEKNLPQEIGRDKLAISFTKGCYLGQETVARIDAMGHVNWHLVRIKIESESVPVADAEIEADEKSVGRITSAARLGGETWALGYIRREVVERGDKIVVGGAPAIVG